MPADSTRNRIGNLINWIGRLVLYLAFLLFVFEGSCWLAIKAYLSLADRSRVNAMAGDHAAASELVYVQSNSILFPTRWYTNKPNFRGNYVITDPSGFRIDPMATREQKSIGFFGGSTMFSAVTSQQDTIPAQVHLAGFNSLNFGVGGYSTAAELPTFIEAMRKYSSIRIAVFYDGVNEIGRYLEMLQDNAPQAAFGPVGYYYRIGVDTALGSYFPTARPTFVVRTPSMRILERLLLRGAAASQITESGLGEIAQRIADQYFSNVEDISKTAQANLVRPVFIFQPNIFTTKKLLTANERAIVQSDATLMPKLAPLVRATIFADPRARRFSVIDASDVLDSAEGEIFYDWCHVNRVGNRIVADRIFSVISKSAAP